MRRERENRGGRGGAGRSRSGRRSSGDPGAGRERHTPKAERRESKRDLPPEWPAAILQHWARLNWLDLEWQRGTARYAPIEAGQVILGDLDDGRPRTDLSGEELRAEALAVAEMCWAICIEQASKEGEISARITGYHVEADGQDVELFSIARRCSVEDEPAGHEGGNGLDVGEMGTWSRNVNTYTGGLQQHALGLLKGVAEPMAKVGELQTMVVGMLGRVIGEREALLRERWEREATKLGLERTRMRLDAAERVAKKALDLLGGELGAAVLDFAERAWDLGHVQSLQEAAAELHASWPASAMFLLQELATKDNDGELSRDWLACLNVAAHAQTEEEAAFSVDAVWTRFERYWPSLRTLLTRRQVVIVAYIRGRIVLEKEAAAAASGGA